MLIKQLFKFSGMKVILIVLILLTVFEGLIIIKLSKEKKRLDEFIDWTRDRYDKSTKLHQYSIKVYYYDRDLHEVALKYRTFAYKTISIGDLPALDINLTDTEEIQSNKSAYTATVSIDDIASPIFFEITGKRKDGTVFEGSIGSIPGWDIYHEDDPFEVYIYKDHDGLSYR